MCFRPPEVDAGEVVCRSCYMVVGPNPDGTCPECGAQMGDPAPARCDTGACSQPHSAKGTGSTRVSFCLVRILPTGWQT